MKDRFWGIGKGTPNRKRLKKGDHVVFYIGGQEQGFFAGQAVLASDIYSLDPQKKVALSHGIDFYKADFGVDLTEIETWTEPRFLDSQLIAKLGFIANKEKWMVHLIGGVRAISKDDFDTILYPAKQAKDAEIESPAEFQLEKYLHEFIVSNFEKINFGEKLEIYSTKDGEIGTEYPTEAGYIDILCREKKSGDFVVIELKKGWTTDKVVGQTLRYVGWVRENLAKGKNVRGIIIARDFDDKLRYSIPKDPKIEVKTYEIDFKLHSPS
jgi:hypothetical protein